MRRPVLVVLGLLLAGAVPAQDPVVDFAAEIWPILERRCMKCHHAPHRLANGRMKRPKGRVRLDSVEAIRASKRGTLIVPGKPDDSLLLDAISLPGALPRISVFFYTLECQFYILVLRILVKFNFFKEKKIEHF